MKIVVVDIWYKLVIYNAFLEIFLWYKESFIESALFHFLMFCLFFFLFVLKLECFWSSGLDYTDTAHGTTSPQILTCIVFLDHFGL